MRRCWAVLLPALVAGCTGGEPVRAPSDPPPQRVARADGETWKIAAAPISGRADHAAVWTGARMFVWGGLGGPPGKPEPLADGALYDPVTDTWSKIADAPLRARVEPAAVATGRAVLVWGGRSGDRKFTDGAAFDLGTRSWTPLPAAPLSPRSSPFSGWTGREMLVWGGFGTDLFWDGAAYDPAAGTWRKIPAAPLAHSHDPRAVWTGTELFVLAGDARGTRVIAAAYDPAKNTWRRLPGFPDPPHLHGPAVWTGDRVVIPSGTPQSPGRSYSPVTGAWSELPRPKKTFGDLQDPVMTPKGVLSWRGTGRASLYRVAQNAWTTIPLPSTDWHERTPPVWTGEELIVWSGDRCPPTARCLGLIINPDGVALHP